MKTDSISKSTLPPKASGALPLIGHLIEFYRDQEGLFRRGYEENGEVFSILLGNQPVALLVGPEKHKFFFTRTDKELDMEKPYAFLAAMFGKIAFLGSHDTYMRQRPILHSLFGHENMVAYLEVICDTVQDWLDGLGEEGEIEVTAEMIALVKEVAGRSFLGDAVHERLKKDGFWDEYNALSDSLDVVLYDLPLPKFIRRDRAKKRIREILQPLVEERRAHPEEDGFQRLLDQPDSEGEPLPDEVIANFFAALMFAGHETTAGQAAWSVIQLLDQPSYKRSVEEEIAVVLGEGRRIDHTMLRDLKLTQAAVRETGRMRPSAETLLRAVKEDVEVGGYCIPAGWVVMTSTAAAHQLPEIYADPEKYSPERFTERQEGKGFDYISFGGGMHKCTGMNFATAEMVIILALLLSQFELELVTPVEEIGIRRVGSSRPTRAVVRYRRK